MSILCFWCYCMKRAQVGLKEDTVVVPSTMESVKMNDGFKFGFLEFIVGGHAGIIGT